MTDVSHKSGRSFVDIELCSSGEIRRMLDFGLKVKQDPTVVRDALKGENIALVFCQPSTRTRVSFEVGVHQMGGGAIVLKSEEMQLSRGESIKDTARVLSRYVKLIILRVVEHSFLLEANAHSSVPVINALTKHSHPCQVMADIMTYEEKRGCHIAGKTVSWIGDNNNVLNSWIQASVSMKFRLKISAPSCPQDLANKILWAKKTSGNVNYILSPQDAVEGADIVTTDSWTSMGSCSESNVRPDFSGYQVNHSLLAHAKPGHMFLHCLPAHRGQEVSDEVLDGPSSYVLDEAENRLHIQKAIMLWCLGLI